jgi:hypothetical protein
MSENESNTLPWEPVASSTTPPPPPTPEKGLANIVPGQDQFVSPEAPWDRPIQVTREEVEKTDSEVQGARINPDSKPVLLLAVALVFVLMVSSFIVSFFGIWGISLETTNIPGPIAWLPALFLDAAILAYTISFFVFRSRGEPIIKTRIALWFFALLSVAANIAHTVEGITPDMSPYSIAIGLAITGSAPIAVVLSTEEIARLAFQRTMTKPKSRV